MNPMMMELLPLVHQGYCCSQLLLLLMLQAQDRQNPGVVRAAQGLCHGIGQSDGPCGLLTGGVGYVFGTMFGVLINGLIQNLIMFNGQLSSWWTRIAIGALTLIFIGVQSAFSMGKRRQIAVRAIRKNGNGAAGSGAAAAPVQQAAS